MDNQYHPDYVPPPAESLLETIEAIGMPRAELAKRMGQPVHIINASHQAKAVITDEIALQLEQVLRISCLVLVEWRALLSRVSCPSGR